jgi:DNA modification methylase
LANNFISSVWDFSDVTSKETGYLTHDFLRWYGKLIPQLVERLVSLYSDPGETVLANFSGSGTVALEAKLLGRNALGIDPNPLSLLVSSAKSNPSLADLRPTLKEIFREIDSTDSVMGTESIPEAKWFRDGELKALIAIRQAILKHAPIRERDTLLLALAAIVKRVSLVDSRCVNHLVKDNSKRPLDIWNEFESKVQTMMVSIGELGKLSSPGTVNIRQGDSRELEIETDSIDLIISHPPYLGAIDYSNMYQLENVVLGFDQASFKARDISTTSLKKYLEAMQDVFTEMHRVLKPGKRMAVIIGDNRKDGAIQPTFAHFILDAESRLGMKLEDIFIWVTSGKAGMSVKRHGNYIDHNYILVFKKV